jgi:uncharacterized protein with FMN-binding domain
MNKLALSLLVVAASGGYVWEQSRQPSLADPLDAMMADGEARPTEAPSPASATPPAAEPAAADGTTDITDCAAIEPDATSVDVQQLARPAPSAEIANAAMTLEADQALTDGTYTGPVTDAYYGPMQIEVVVQGRRLTALRALQYPSDRRTSILINRQALPMLRDEAITAQSADVDIITGATLTSEAFIRSLSRRRRPQGMSGWE